MTNRLDNLIIATKDATFTPYALEIPPSDYARHKGVGGDKHDPTEIMSWLMMASATDVKNLSLWEHFIRDEWKLEDDADKEEVQKNNTFNYAKANHALATKIMASLALCMEVRDLKPKHVKSFLASIKCDLNPQEIHSVVAKYFRCLNRSSYSDEIIRYILSNKFLKYHTSYSSTGALVMLANTCLPGVFQLDEVTAAKTSAAAPWNMRGNSSIAEETKAMAYIVLEAFKALPDNWYQGTAAVAAYPPPKLIQMRALVKAASKKASATPEDPDMMTLQDLIQEIMEARGRSGVVRDATDPLKRIKGASSASSSSASTSSSTTFVDV